MVERIDEGKIKGAIDAISLKKLGKIEEQMKTCICQVYGDKIGTGFFCKILYQNKLIPVLMTNYHIISDEYLKNNKQVKITINDDKIIDLININEKNKIYSSIKDKYDIMIIKLEKENNYNYLELDDSLFNNNSEQLYEEKSIYILHYPNGDKMSVSFGYGIKKENEYYIKHYCNTEQCSSGSPILNLKTNKLIGIHSGSIVDKNKETKYNIGILLKYPLNKFNNKIKYKSILRNEIIAEFDIKEDNKNIRIINSYGQVNREDNF